MCERRRIAAGAERTEEEGGLGGTELGGQPLLGAERLAGPVELDRDGVAVCMPGHEKHLRGAAALRDPAHGRRGRRELVDRAERKL